MNDSTTPEVQSHHVPAVAPPHRLQYEEAQESWVLLYPEGMVKLNQSAGEILRRCDGERDVAAITALLEKDFEQDNLGTEVTAFLGIALQQRWVTVNGNPST